MREDQPRQAVTKTNEDIGKETGNTQQCRAEAVADIDT